MTDLRSAPYNTRDGFNFLLTEACVTLKKSPGLVCGSTAISASCWLPDSHSSPWLRDSIPSLLHNIFDPALTHFRPATIKIIQLPPYALNTDDSVQGQKSRGVQRGKLVHMIENTVASPHNPAPSPSFKIERTLLFHRGLVRMNN